MKKSFFYILSFVLMYFLVRPLPLSAQSGLVSGELIAVGKKYMDSGQTQKAIHEFSKAYMLDPDNPEVIKYLHMLGLEEGIYGRQKTRLGQAKEYGQKINTYKAKVNELEGLNAIQTEQKAVLEEDGEYLRQAILSKETENERIRTDMRDTRRESSEQAQRDAGLIKDIQSDNERKAKELLRLNDRIYQLKDDMVAKLADLEDRDRQIANLTKDMKMKNFEWQNRALDYQKEINDLERSYNRHQHDIAISDDKRVEQLKSLRNALREDRRQLAIAKNRVILDQYHMADSDKKIIDKNKEILQLRKTLSDLESKLSGVETGLLDNNASSGESMGVKEVSGATDTALLRRQDRQIADLKEQLVRAHREIEAIGQGDEKGQEDRIAVLKEELAAVKAKLEESENKLVEKDEEKNLLQARFDDTSQRLSVVEKIMREKEAEIKELEDQLTDALGDLGEDQGAPDEKPAPQPAADSLKPTAL